MDVCNYDLQTALHIAVMENQEHIVEFLLTKCKQTKLADTAKDSLHKEDVDMNKKDHNGKTALHFAASAKKTEAVKFLVYDANVDSLIPDRYNRFPMDEEMNEGTKSIITKYQNAPKENKMELKMSAQEDAFVLVMKASFKGILHKQTDPRYKYFNMESCDDDGDTPLHKSAVNGNLEDVIYLLGGRRACLFVRNKFLKTDATLIDRLDYYGRSALHIAAAAGHTHLVKFLIEQGAEKNKIDRYNVTPFDEAKMNRDDDMQHMLKD
ncbi:serine/threonine-protein phosphatase 6 regulatory ankyrin repeat subunit C-like [Mytilus trossulus]|uniref:serine/threonine-protein phosphatase 6 regulatory ankyrin repeat subunit C-like n=1 Tax=Mytilus trossulus TaxID=6551 RepID=UPI0030044E4E